MDRLPLGDRSGCARRPPSTLEVYAFREAGSAEWLYPGWQFEDDGNVKPEVARVLAAARQSGIEPIG